MPNNPGDPNTNQTPKTIRPTRPDTGVEDPPPTDEPVPTKESPGAPKPVKTNA